MPIAILGAVYAIETRTRALKLLATGLTLSEVSRRVGISRSAIREWRDRPVSRKPVATDCPVCTGALDGIDEPAYAYLLGLYLGDGCISAHRKGVYTLRITMDDKYPGLVSEAHAALLAVRPAARIFLVRRIGCTDVQVYWKHWICLFPQHGPGMKHTRPIVLEPWQRDIAARHPGTFLRGLFHSDGCRITNWTTRKVAGQTKRYEYPRYFFSNESRDIIDLCTWALDLLGIAWRRPRPNAVSVARREAVAELDRYVGPKY